MADRDDPLEHNDLDIKLIVAGEVAGHVRFFVESPEHLAGHVSGLDIENVELKEAVERALFENEGRVSVTGGSIPGDVSDDYRAILRALDFVRRSFEFEWEAPDVFHALDEDQEGRVY